MKNFSQKWSYSPNSRTSKYVYITKHSEFQGERDIFLVQRFTDQKIIKRRISKMTILIRYGHVSMCVNTYVCICFCVHIILIHFLLQWHNTTGWVDYKERRFILAHGSGGAWSGAASSDRLLAGSPQTTQDVTCWETGSMCVTIYLAALSLSLSLSFSL
jgi:hypothetical protein